ncbi:MULTISPECIES: Hsp70 family protein [unclassified Nocardia]|uniref:Hsp70 family protein n=1 Tax=unclassified Nocardia TaxID=2637762 RepID=UPI001CE4816D|nr:MULTISPECIES: Hsp70 family protein [unclassified Nocardia]
MNSVSASVTGERPRPAVRTRRTAVTFDSTGSARIGGIPQFTMAVTDFADLTRDPESVVVGGRLWSPTNLVAAVVNGLIEAAEPNAGVVTTYPATYSEKQVALLRQALDLAGAAHVMLVPEPVAAAEWLAHEYGPLETGFVLVYDLGGNCLDVAVVRVGPDWDNHPMVGKPMRSYDFGGRPLGAMIARYAKGVLPDRSGSLSMTSIVDIDSLRTEHVRDSLEIVRACVRSADITMSDITRVLLVGGAARPPEVARTLAELGRPVVISADPGHSIAAGAAFMAARTMAPTGPGDNKTPRVAVFSSAAAVSAMAMSAMTVFGGPGGPGPTAILDPFPAIDAPVDALLYDMHAEDLLNRDAPVSEWSLTRTSGNPIAGSAYGRFITPVARSVQLGPSMADSLIGHRADPRSLSDSVESMYTYANPAQFVNPLPFLRSQPSVTPQSGWPAPAPVPPAAQPPAPAPQPPAPVSAPPQGGPAPAPVGAPTTPGKPTDTTVSASTPSSTAASGTPASSGAGSPTGTVSTGTQSGAPASNGGSPSTGTVSETSSSTSSSSGTAAKDTSSSSGASAGSNPSGRSSGNSSSGDHTSGSSNDGSSAKGGSTGEKSTTSSHETSSSGPSSAGASSGRSAEAAGSHESSHGGSSSGGARGH